MFLKQKTQGPDHSITSTTSHSSSNLFGKFIEATQNTIETVKDVIEDGVSKAKEIIDIGSLIASVLADPGKIFANLPVLKNLTGYDLSPDEWMIVKQALDGNYQLQRIKLCCQSVIDSRLEMQEAERVKTIIREAQQEICTSVLTLSKPIYTQFQDSQIQKAYHELKSNFGRRFLELCKDTANALQEYMPPSPPLPPQTSSITLNYNQSNLIFGSNNPTYTDADYLNIVRKYILFLNEKPNDIIHTQQFLLSVANKAQKIFSEQSETLRPILYIDSLNMVLPLETCFLGLVWCTMYYELMTTAYGDISVDNQTLLISNCNLFVVLLFTLLSREGLPAVLDGGTTNMVAKSVRLGYTTFHNVVKPIVDLGASFINIYLEQTNSNFVITKSQSWNKTLSSNIHGEDGHTLKMWTALNMLHTFRVADAFLSSILANNAFCIESLKECLMKLSPIPLNGEENKLLTLFWNNPYKDGVSIQSKPIYGVFFNYNSEIEAIYEKYARNMGHQLTDVLIASNNIFNEIHELNNRIGKGDPSTFDHYLVFCIAGELKNHYSRQCLLEMSQPTLASHIYQHITQHALT